MEARDTEALTEILADDVTHINDGGEVKEAAERAIECANRVERFLLSIAEKSANALQVRPVRVNGRLGLLVLQEDRVHSVWCIRVVDGRIRAIYCVRNPEKLRHFARTPLGERDRTPR